MRLPKCESATVQLDDIARDGQPKPGAGTPGRLVMSS